MPIFRRFCWPPQAAVVAGAWALAVLLHLAACQQGLHNLSWMQDDSVEYRQLAHNLLQHGAYSLQDQPPLVPTAYRLPGYPVFLALLGGHPAWVLGVQHLLVLATALLLVHLLRPHLGKPAARWAGLAWAFSPMALWMANLMLTESLFIFLLVLGLVLGQRATATGRARWVLGCLLVLAAASLVKGLGLAALGLLGLRLAWKAAPKPVALLRLGLLALPAVLMLGSWAWRNHQHMHKFGLGGGGFVTGWYGHTGGALVLKNNAPQTDAERFWLADSMAASVLGGPNLYAFAPGSQGVEALHTAAPVFDTHLGHTRGGISRADFLKLRLQGLWQQARGLGWGTALQSAESRWVANLSAGLQAVWLVGVGLGLLLWAAQPSRWKPNTALWALLALALLWLHAAPWADGRYRLIADPLLLALASLGWQALCSRWEGRRPRKRPLNPRA